MPGGCQPSSHGTAPSDSLLSLEWMSFSGGKADTGHLPRHSVPACSSAVALCRSSKAAALQNPGTWTHSVELTENWAPSFG